MLPEFLFSVGQSMQDITRDDYNILNGAANTDSQQNIQNTNEIEIENITYNTNNTNNNNNNNNNSNSNNNHNHKSEEKGMCVTSSRCNADINAAAVITDEICSRLKSTTSLDGTETVNGIKLEETINGIDLFPTHPSTWQQHPMNSEEHAHHRLQHQQQQQQQQQQPEHQQMHNLHPHRFGLASNSKLLLQSSDDPLICRGANDDEHPLELKSLIAAVASDRQQHQELPDVSLLNSSQTKRPQNGCSSLTKQQLKMKAGLMSAAQQQHQQQQQQEPQTQTVLNKYISSSNNGANCGSKSRNPKTKVKKSGVLKLRFHHQALPPEYLSHYEATQAQFAVRNAQQQQQQQSQQKQQEQLQQTAKSKECCHYNQQYKPQPPKVAQTAKLPPPKSSHENVRSWLQKIAEIQRSAEQQQRKQRQIVKTSQQPPLPVVDHNHDAYKNKIDQETAAPPALIHMPLNEFSQGSTNKSSQKLLTPVNDCSAMVRHSPPPLLPAPSADTSHPTNKRIIQYADLPYMGEITLHSKPRRGRKPKKADICHLIYKNYGTIFPGTPQHALSTQNSSSTSLAIVNKEQMNRTMDVSSDEPLNLCLRDQRTDLCSVSSFEDGSDLPSTDSGSSACTPVPTTPIDHVTDSLLAANMRSSMPRLEQQPKISSTNKTATTSVSQLHPVSVYYQKLIESSSLLQPNGLILGMPIETIEKDNQIALKIPIPSGLLLLPKSEKISPATTSAVSGAIDYPEPLSTPSSIKSETSTLSVNNNTPLQQMAPQKRKRSAIFIPPVPAESASNPATEVSICKFKFTGGPKPMLQEKKMLSVDSDGNYRYYSGTAGDKNLRCEFFPRESLQQSGVLPGVNSPSGVCSNTTNEKISIDIPPPSAGLSNELLQLPESPTSTLLLPPPVASPSSPHTPSIFPYTGTSTNTAQPQQTPLVSSKLGAKNHLPVCQTSDIRRGEHKKKSRRSSQLEKFEKTFKENGFLIQTQQLESAEGATYCKFRQLKKFTRYLFRNWKDYLPDELQQAKAAAAAAAAITNGNAATPEDAVALENLLASHGFVSVSNHLHSEVIQKRENLEESAVRDVQVGENEWEAAKL